MNQIKSLFGLILLVVFVSNGCKQASDNEVADLKAEEFLNVSYGTSARNTMDVYLPAQRSESTPLIILIHGGSWVEGDKSSFTDLARYWRDKGYAAISMNYRLTNTAENNIHPAQVNDIAKLITFVASIAKEWNVSSSKIGLQGASAGAHLALLYAYNYNSDAKVKAVISLAGPTDLTAISAGGQQQAQVVQWLIGASYQANPTAYAQASPMTHVKATSSPTLLFHGKLDVVVPYQQSVALEAKLKQAGAATKIVLYDNTGHEVLNLNNTASFLADCEAWWKLYLK